MAFLVDPQGRPSALARYASHAVVGGVAVYALKKIGPVPALIAALIVIGMHEHFDAPVARYLASSGL